MLKLLLIAIDPGKHIGWALAYGGQAIACGTATTFEQLPRASLAIIEMPRVYPSVNKWKGDPQHIVRLAYFAGQIAERYPAHVRVEPFKVPKRVTRQRALAMLRPEELCVLPRRISNHAYDALAHLLYALSRKPTIVM